MDHHRTRAGRRGLLCSAATALALISAGCTSGGEDGGPPIGGPGGNTRSGSGGNSLPAKIEFQVRNADARARIETIRASVPFAEGAVNDLSDMAVSGHQVAWHPMQQWADGSVRVAQVQFTDRLDGNQSKRYEVVSGGQTLGGPFEQNSWVGAVGSNLEISARVRDTLGVEYRAQISGPGEVLQESYLVRVTRHRVYHRAPSGGIGRDYLASTFYLTEFRDMPYVLVDWVLGNDYLGADKPGSSTDPNLFPLGAIDVDRAEFAVRGAYESRGYLAAKHAIQSPTTGQAGWEVYEVMKDTFIDDGQTRRYRFGLYAVPAGAAQNEVDGWSDRFDAFMSAPLRPLAKLATWQQTAAMGLHGGPIDPPSDAAGRADKDFYSWNGAQRFGTWGDFGEIQFTNTTGTPRNAPVSAELAHAAQSGDDRLLLVLEQKAWAQAQRPYHMFGLHVGAQEDVYLWDPIPSFPNSRNLSPESYGRKKLWSGKDPYAAYRTRVNFNAHGWNGYDHEHWSTDLLFDYWTMSGDEWAKEELRQLGESLKGLMRLRTFPTATLQSARAEGWCMVGFVQIYLATGDESIKDYALRRLHEVIERDRSKNHPSKCLAIQGSYPGTGYPGNHRFFMPWQHGPVLYGMLGAHKFFEDPLALTIAEDVVPTVEYAWVRNYNDPKWGLVVDGLRYYVPTHYNGQPVPADYFDSTVGVKWGDSPLGGAHSFLVSGLFLLAERTGDAALSDKALHYTRILLGPIADGKRWYKWNAAVPEYLITP